MQTVQQVTGSGVPLLLDDIDTDRIIPARYLRCVTFDGLGEHAFEDDRKQDASHPFDDARFANGSVLVSGRNFGCGSSREHAPWALLDYGIKCVISTSFADIFYNNCFKNGILPIKVSKEQLDQLMDDAERGANATLTVDLATQTIQGPDGGEIAFEMDDFKKHCLLNGLDDVGLTMENKGKIEEFENQTKGSQPWLFAAE